jgi:hypothetical protein
MGSRRAVRTVPELRLKLETAEVSARSRGLGLSGLHTQQCPESLEHVRLVMSGL